MTSESTLQLFADGAWHDAAAVMLLGAEQQGWQAATLMGYATEWALAHGGAQDAHALAYAYPVSLEARRLPHWPTFLLDLLPQGFGRMELLRQLGLAENAGPSADWRLLRGGRRQSGGASTDQRGCGMAFGAASSSTRLQR